MTDTIHPWARPGLTTEKRAAIARDYHYGSYDLVKEACDAAVAQALADNAPKVEWLPADGRHCDFVDLYITNGDVVMELDRYENIPDWVTHFAVVPPRTLPAPPQEEQE